MAKRKETEVQTRTRVLLALWGLGPTDVKRGDLTKRIVRSGERSSDYTALLRNLEERGAIATAKKKYSLVHPQGVQLLSQGLNDPGFQFKSQVGAKTVNMLLKWIREMGSANPDLDGTTPIDSYEAFKDLALEVYDRLNRDYSLDDLVPIYQIRREIGEQVTRHQFNEWMLEMQASDIFQLQKGEVSDITPEKAEDSITTELGGLRYYAKRLSI